MDKAKKEKDLTLKHSTEIGKALSTVVQSRSPLTLRIDDRLTPYMSLLVEVDSDEKVFYIDELLPKNGNKMLVAGERFSITALSRGIPVFFKDNQILSTEEIDGSLAYKIAFPTRLVYEQRRQFFRISVGITQNCDAVLARVEADDEETKQASIRGRVIDISQRGIGIQFPGELVPELSIGEWLQECEIGLPDDEVVNCPAEVSHFFYDEDRDISTCGLSFHELDKQQQRKIDRYVLHLQREARKSPGA